MTINQHYLYYNCEKYPLSPLKPRSLAFIEQYLPNISDPVYSVHQSFMWFLWLNWRKSHFIPSLLQMIQNVDLLWCHRYTRAGCQPLWRHNDRLFPHGFYGHFIINSQGLNVCAIWNRKLITAYWATKNTSCFNFFVYFCDPRVLTRGIASTIWFPFFCSHLIRNLRTRRCIDSSSIIAHPVNFGENR